MKKLISRVSLCLILIGFSNNLFAQPANDACASAIPIAVTAGSCSSTLYTNVAATSVGDPAVPPCWSPNSLSHSVWFSFVATKPDIEISTNFSGSLANTQLAVYSGTCGSLTQIACQEDINAASGLFHADVVLHGLTTGNTYYLLVDGNGNTTGTFGICAQEALPIGPTLPVQDCVTALTLCNLNSISVPNGPGSVGVNQESPSCFGAPGERSSNWYSFTVATSGILQFTITPTSTIDYDFAVFNTSSSCPGTEISCNWNGTTGPSGITGLGCSGPQCNPTINVAAGQTYTILVDRFTSTSSAGFTLDFTGTTATVTSPNPSFTATTACIGTSTQFTSTTNGNYTYNWNFGDGFTSTLQNPSHTYASAGSYNVTLLVTAVPGGCQNAITLPVTVKPLPVVDAGIATPVCSGGCTTLSGSTNALGAIEPFPFSNNNTYAIPDNNPTGVHSPVSVSGIIPATINNTSIASVCLSIAHTWDADVDIFLVCPNGTQLELSTDNGGSGDNYTNTCFTPTAINPITSGVPPFTGTYAPEQAFSLLNGCNANGTWQLFVRDDAGAITGNITGWTITFNNNLPPYTWSPTTAMTNATTLTPTICPSSTTTYTLTASNGIGCTTTDTVTVNVNTPVTPTFTAVPPICSGAILAALPTTSNNGIIGTWSPALNNTATTTYTFTPAVGQCAVPTTLTIMVNPNISSVFSGTTPICSGATLTPLPTTSNNGITGTWAPALNNTTTTTYTFTPTAGQCATITTLTITVNPNVTPAFTTVAPICSGATLTPLPTTSNNGITGTWAPTLNNTATTTYTFTPTAGQCAAITTLTITVNPNITPTFTAIAPICSGSTLSALPNTSNNGYTGTWTPALNNTATTTYTFTPTVGQCATITTLTVTVNPNITPTFTAVPPVCSGSTLSALPTTSNNGYTGTWTPALNNTATTTYTFTPTVGQCATITTLTVTVNPNITPTFTAVPPLCSGGTIAALPTTSNNGYTGTWSPTLNNTATTTYTFTPTAGQCATNTTLTVTVNPNITPTFTAVAPICSGGTLSALPTTSNNGYNGSWSPALNNNATTTYTFTPTVGQCATITTLTVIVNPNITPTFTAVAPICSGGTLSALPNISNNGYNGSWSPALNNNTTTTYTFTPTVGQCATTTTLTVIVNPNITPTFTAVVPICSGGTLSALPTTSNNGYNGSWSPALNNNATTTYTFTPTVGQCATTTTLTVIVNPNITPTFMAVAPICSGGTLSALPTTSNNGYNGSWSPALDNTTTTTYTFTPTVGQCATTTILTITVNPNITPTFTAIAPICSGGTLSALPNTSNNGYTGTWSPALNNNATTTYTFTPTVGQCATITTLTVIVNPNITPTFTAVTPICLGGTLSALPNTSNNGYTGTWIPALDNTTTTTYTFTPNIGQCATITTLTVIVNPNIAPTFTAVTPICSGGTLSALPNISNNGYSGTWIPALDNTATTTYTFTPTVGQCATNTTLIITVNPNIAPTFTAVAPICLGGTLSALPNISNNGFTGTWAPPLNNTATTTYTFTPATGQCAISTTLTITVIPNVTPTFTAIAPICSGDTLPALPITSNNGYTGTWAPALNNTATTAYTFTPTIGQCVTPTTLTITVYALPQLNSIPPLYYCDSNNDGFGVFDLTQVVPIITGGNPYPVSFHETITDAEINGTVIPNPSAYPNIFADHQIIYIRVESVETAMCYKVITLELIVNPTPEAQKPNDYHVCDNNYDGFASFNLTTITPEVMGSINPATHNIAYYTSLADAISETNPISNLINFINQTVDTQTLWIRVENNTTGCYDVVTLQLIVDPLPTAMQPSYTPYSLCDTSLPNQYEIFDLGSKISDILMGQTGVNVTFYFSQADAMAEVNELPLLYTNAVPAVQTLWIRLENTDSGCFVLSTIDIRVEPVPSPVPPDEPYTVCDTNQDGISEFNLNTLTPDILQGANYTVTYHETLTDAELGNNPLISPYFNLYPFIQFIYAAAVDNTNGCRSVIPIELHVDPKPKMPVTIAPLVQCDQDNNPQNQSMIFDLTQVTPLVLAEQDLPATSYSISYYTTQANAISGLNPIINTTNYTGFNHQIIWIRIENNSTDCFAIGSFELLVNPPLALTTPTPLNMCDDDNVPNNLYTVFDLTVKNSEITQGQPNMTVTYYPNHPVTASSVPIPNPTTYTNINPAVQTLGVMITNAQGCRSYTTLDIRVLPIPTPNNPHTSAPEMVLPAQCETVAWSGVAVFDLTTYQSYITNGDPNVELHYFPSHTDLINNTNEIVNPGSATVGDTSIAGTTINQIQYVYIAVSSKVFADYTGRKCYREVQQGFIVNPLPVVAVISDYQICENDPSGINDGIEVFDLTSQKNALLAGNQTTPASNYSVQFYEDSNLTLPINTPSNYTNTANPQLIFVQITNTTTGCKSAVGSFTIKVNPKPTATVPANFVTCDTDAINDGFYTLDLSSYINGIIGSQTNVNTTFYNNLSDAQNGINAITDLVNYQAYTHTLWIRVEDATTGCYQLARFMLVVEKLAEPIITSDSDTICVAYGSNTLISGTQLNSGITNNNYTFTWSLNGTIIPNATGPTHLINTVAPGNYTVIATSKKPPLLGCVSPVSNTFTVIQSGPPVALNPAYTISNAFETNQTVTVNILGFGEYEYSLDDGPFQSSNIFQNLSSAPHTITIRDVKTNNSCGEIVLVDIQTIDYPHYFTPNNDSYHDTWNVTGLENKPARLYIFDRYGKLLKQLSTSGDGWDGTYNGHELPATDYWFKVEYPEGSEWKEFKAHFSLKR